MAGTRTTWYSLYKPAVGERGWGSQVDINFDVIDAELHRLAAAVAAATSTGTPSFLFDSVTGALLIDGAGGDQLTEVVP